MFRPTESILFSWSIAGFGSEQVATGEQEQIVMFAKLKKDGLQHL